MDVPPLIACEWDCDPKGDLARSSIYCLIDGFMSILTYLYLKLDSNE